MFTHIDLLVPFNTNNSDTQFDTLAWTYSTIPAEGTARVPSVTFNYVATIIDSLIESEPKRFNPYYRSLKLFDDGAGTYYTLPAPTEIPDIVGPGIGGTTPMAYPFAAVNLYGLSDYNLINANGLAGPFFIFPQYTNWKVIVRATAPEVLPLYSFSPMEVFGRGASGNPQGILQFDSIPTSAWFQHPVDSKYYCEIERECKFGNEFIQIGATNSGTVIITLGEAIYQI
jgi:hypothetical protein